MAFIKSAVKLFLREYPTYAYRNPVLALGVPEFYATADEMREWTRTLAGKDFPMAPCTPAVTQNPAGAALGWVSAEYFFKGLGLDDVTSVDIPGSEHAAAFTHDLNMPFPVEHTNKYNLIMDPGTIEHVFDMKTCLTNCVRALRVGGVIFHEVPVYSFNGGYYSLNPNLLNDFYSHNGFVDLKTYIIMWDRYHPYTGKSRCYEYSGEVMSARHALADFDQCRYSPTMVFFARKQSEVASIVSPLQFEGHYHPPEDKGDEAAAPAQPSPLSAVGIRRAVRTMLNKLPRSAAEELTGRLTRLRTLQLTRRKSFWI